MVSIHATLAGGDEMRSPIMSIMLWFLSTPPSRVATITVKALQQGRGVSIHATLAGGDGETFSLKNHALIVSIHATLAGGDLHRINLLSAKLIVSIHATLAGGDCRVLR